VDGKTVRPLGAENDKAFALINALDEGQRKQAILNYKVADLVLGPGQDGKTIQPEGIKCSAMNASQQAMLLDLVGEWAGIVHEQAAAARMAEIKANLPETWFAWSGPTTNGMPAYYRIQGPTVVIEYAPQPLGGDPTMHIHTIYRDPDERLREEVSGALSTITMKRMGVSALLALSLVGSAAAHRLDEYLQATLIGVTPAGIDVEIHLTPGVAMLPVLMAVIDQDGDGRISPEEERAYAGRVAREVELRVDGVAAPLWLTESNFPTLEAMREGLGTIRMKLHTARIGECADLSFDCLHLVGPQRWAIHVPLGKLKTERMVPADAFVVRLVERLRLLRSQDPLPADGFLLARPSSRNALLRSLRSFWRDILVSVGIAKRLVPHQLRHSYGTEMTRAGVSLLAVMKLLGHLKPEMSLHYVEVSLLDLEREFLLARSQPRHLMPTSRLLASPASHQANLASLLDALHVARHVLEMYRRTLPQGRQRRLFGRLANRLTKIAAEARKPGRG
jgi:hypothetical protein